jgi:predicted lipid-binding transport protein (Tim44 family)
MIGTERYRRGNTYRQRDGKEYPDIAFNSYISGWGGYGLGGLGLGGLGGGLGTGGVLGDLLSGGLGYLMGKRSAQNQQQQLAQYQQYPPQYQQYPPQYQQPYQQSAPQYQQPAPQYQPPAQFAQTSTGSTQNSRLTQLKLLGQLREQGVLTDDEFQAEKQRILNGS